MVSGFGPNKPDHQILNGAYTLSKSEPGYEVVLVSKDVNLRMKAKAVGLQSEDYTNDHVEDVSALYTGKSTLEELDQSIIDKLYDTRHFESSRLKVDVPLPANEHVILRNHNKSDLAVYDNDEKILRRVTKKSYLPVIYSKAITPTSTPSLVA